MPDKLINRLDELTGIQYLPAVLCRVGNIIARLQVALQKHSAMLELLMHFHFQLHPHTCVEPVVLKRFFQGRTTVLSVITMFVGLVSIWFSGFHTCNSYVYTWVSGYSSPRCSCVCCVMFQADMYDTCSVLAWPDAAVSLAQFGISPVQIVSAGNANGVLGGVMHCSSLRMALVKYSGRLQGWQRSWRCSTCHSQQQSEWPP